MHSLNKVLTCAIALSVSVVAYAQTPATPADEPITGAALVRVGEATVKKSLVAMPAFQYAGNVAANPHRNVQVDLFDTITSDLTLSEYFTFIRPEAFLEDTSKLALKPASDKSVPEGKGFRFESWKQIGTEFLIRGAFNVVDKELSLEVYVYNVPQSQLVFGKIYKGTLSQTKYMAHLFANDVLEKITGRKGFFTTKILVSSDKAGFQKKEIYMMDWDGSNMEQVTDHKSLAISPTWAPDGKSIVYSNFAMHVTTKSRNIDLFRYDLTTGRRWLISFVKGINSGAAFFPSGDRLVATLSKGDSPDLYEIDRDGKVLKRITNGPAGAMNVEPAVSPDGRKIAFSSDRAGNPMIYVMNADGTGVERITFAGKFNASPAWSPDGKTLAFAGWDRNHFDIFTVNADKTGLRRLTSATKPNGKEASNEDPHFSPDGRRIVFVSNRTGTFQVYMVNLDGSDERQITKDKFNYYKPKWSPWLD